MKRNFIKIPVLVLGFMTSALSLNSCVKEDEISITEPIRYTRGDVKSYADFFKLFWTVMDERYNYFYEQKRKDGMDWDAIYKEYYPKFAALKSYKQEGFTDLERESDAQKAEKYFQDIIEPIIDRHFVTDITLPVGKTVRFRGDSKSKKDNIYDFTAKKAYMINQLATNSIIDSNLKNNDGEIAFSFLAGSLKSNPEIYYLTSDNFSFYNLVIDPNSYFIREKPLNVNENILTQAKIESNAELNAIIDISERNKMRDFTLDILNQWNSFLTSADIKNFNEEINKFKNNDIVSDAFATAAENLSKKSKSLPAYDQASTYAKVLNPKTKDYIVWFSQHMKSHVEKDYNFAEPKIGQLLSKRQFYQKLFNPLQKGEIKKLIIDLRDNGGGAVVDFKYFIERFVTKNAVYAYQRTKEGTGRFNYTPWVPVEAKRHQYAMPTNIPITILTDKGSMSMSEMSTLMLKSQGSQVVSIGDYTGGGTAGLSTNLDSFNGGINNFNNNTIVAGLIKFYVPLMATKNIKGEVIEGIGIKPDIYVTPPTDTEIKEMKDSPKTFLDRVIAEAVKWLSSK